MAKRKRAEEEAEAKAIGYKQIHDFQLAWYLIAIAHAVNATLNLAITSFTVYYYIHHPGIGTLCQLHAIIVWLKTCSYALTNRDLRLAYLYPDASDPLPELYQSCPYPQNITLQNISYFWWAPTLVYQPVYPRTNNIRWTFVCKRMAEVVGLSIVIWIASAQYAVPLLQNSLDHVAALDLISIAERVMKLSTISLFCWLAGFFALFQSFLNALAEVMRFGDREFYSDWWNVSSVRIYWTTWNKPVYHFMKRHIYAPLIGRGVPPWLAQGIVFVFSGLMHELLVGVPTHNILCKIPWTPFAFESLANAVSRGGVCRNDVASPSHHSHRPSCEDEELHGEDSRQYGILDYILFGWTTFSGTSVLLCMAGEIWQRGTQS